MARSRNALRSPAAARPSTASNSRSICPASRCPGSRVPSSAPGPPAPPDSPGCRDAPGESDRSSARRRVPGRPTAWPAPGGAARPESRAAPAGPPLPSSTPAVVPVAESLETPRDHGGRPGRCGARPGAPSPGVRETRAIGGRQRTRCSQPAPPMPQNPPAPAHQPPFALLFLFSRCPPAVALPPASGSTSPQFAFMGWKCPGSASRR